MSEQETNLRALKVPEQGTPELITTEDQFAHAINELKSGHGPIAIDAERASGFRYSSRAYLIQIYRRGGGLHLIDPIQFNQSPLISQLNDQGQLSDILQFLLLIQYQIALSDLCPNHEDKADLEYWHG